MAQVYSDPFQLQAYLQETVENASRTVQLAGGEEVFVV
jgi:hypothetical protein